jgi:alkylation response protein AidB-like acyl-CoA dehydrogenase
LLLEAIASQNRIIASAFAEPDLGGSLLRSTVRAKRAAGGYLVGGVKSPCSLAAYCDLVCFQMQTDPAGPDGLMMAMIPAATPGIRVERTWDALGMRASGSDTLRLEEVFVPDQLIYHRCNPGSEDGGVFLTGLIWFCITTTATYLGVAAAAIATACDALRGSPSARGTVRAELPSVQGQLGQVLARTLPLEAACIAVAERVDGGLHDPGNLLPLAVAIKHSAVDACTRAVERSAELAGARSYARASKLARLWRDVQAARFHPPNRLLGEQLLGQRALDRMCDFDLKGC